MKTKIIYISGNETFEMTQIRAAFEEVRETLGLDKDTILFGVPVDCDSALEDMKTSENTVSDNVISIDTTPEIIDTPIETIPVIEPVTDTADEPADTTSDDIVPILSVLATNDEPVAETIPVEDVEITVAQPETEIIDDVEPVADDVTPDTEIIEDAETETVTVAEIDDTEIPENPMEKTLEELLESMTPLREDVIPQESDDAPSVTTEDVLSPDDTDATLAQLATEFVQNEDKIPVAPKTETSGKIGKFKNILPFKKAKRDDSGIMGDLFGWAGVAANDEDFSIPGFFTQAASKK